MGAFAKLFSFFDKILDVLFLKVLPEVLRLVILSGCIIWKYYMSSTSNYKYVSMINKKSSKFAYKKRVKPELVECRICLSEFVEGDEVREIVDCKHGFHRHCLEIWLQGYGARCPLCRSLVVPEVILAEYHQMQIEQQTNNGFEKELALILLKALDGGIFCNRSF
ncbi:hypothetical protein BUALT_Bualt15G0131500 [Buddleja alternifolia]|uniref:RING-type domain-containing protein n=1 Tax=Buddleja alternifolia TaxID=168488 RepID=A0AAV6WK28_9LAMI|nr:hypothetical protein BUALT_Bualt15G0131500 [Buddleja alternifolia]